MIRQHQKPLRLMCIFSTHLFAVLLSTQAQACVQNTNIDIENSDTLSECVKTPNPQVSAEVIQFLQQNQPTKNKNKTATKETKATSKTKKALVFKTYPFEASQADKSVAFATLPLIEVGQPINSACKLLGQADEIRVLYEPKAYKPKAVGFTYWYVYRRGQTANHQTDQVIRISTDNQLTITKVDSWGYE